MSAQTKEHGHGSQSEAAHIKFYTKIYVALLVLFLVSVAGPVVRLTPDRHEAILRALRATASDLSLAWPSQPSAEAARRRRA